MQISTSLIKQDLRQFIPENFQINGWKDMESFYIDLESREINSQEEFEKWFKDWDELYAVISEDSRWKYIRTSVDTTDKEAQEALEKHHIHVSPKMQPWENKLQKKFNDSPYAAGLSEDFSNLKKGIAKDLALFTEKNIDLKKELSLKENEYANITGAWSIEYKGKEYTMPQAGKFMKSVNRKEREEVYFLEKEREAQDKDKLDDLLSVLIKKRHQLALNAGYKNFRDYQFDAKHRFDYTAKDCEDFHQSVATAIIPLLKKMDGQRKQDLKVATLKPWDLSVDPLERAPLQPFETTDKFVQKTIDCFNQLDPYFGQCVADMYENGRLDLESRKGKAPGGYMMSMPESGVPFIFMNHAASEGDVRVMVHEGGHAIHSFLDYELPYAVMRGTPSEVAELASMTMELFSLENWESFYENKDDLSRAKRNHLEGLLKLLPSVAKGDAFQHWMYTNPGHSISERRAKWSALGEKFSTGVTDQSGLEKYNEIGYQGILHFYQVPFYYIEYGFAQLGAIAMWRNYKIDKEKAIEDYKNALRLGYTRSIPKIYETAGIRFDFSQDYVQNLAAFVHAELSKL